MKNLFLLSMLMLAHSFAIAQYKKDGTPDMRYNSNRQMYGNSYCSPSYGTTNPSIDYQSSYVRNGTYVEPSFHTKSNNTNTDNWSTSGNTNPLTGSLGTRARDYSNEAYNYGQGQVIQTGPRGGQYYQNSNGNRTYIPKREY
ncbi:hypothetical protein EXU85_09820 [Spirosoma sp. KCTC 42546]|uniref:hypothetical protein n=1 Tax=Spirosoma sp. KCTC 42546 TaxID=2520506 RepID=UPI00115A1450|nr:hypothetical protein [Spirosoma sp. KCTC 42546]QDK78885.1 hypothetical protein EXU85_09820 [Spirosoma sp. KCTC 42546]